MEKTTKPYTGFVQDFFIGKINYAEISRFGHIKARSVRYKHIFLFQQIHGKFLVVVDVNLLRIYLREDIKCRIGFNNAYTVYRRKFVVNDFTLFEKSSAGQKQFVGALNASERGLDYGLCGNVGAKTHGGKQIYALNITFCVLLRTA